MFTPTSPRNLSATPDTLHEEIEALRILCRQDREAAPPRLEALLQQAQEQNDFRAEALTLLLQASNAIRQGHFEVAATILADVMERNQEHQDFRVEGTLLQTQSLYFHHRSENMQALGCAYRCVALWQEIDAPGELASALQHLGAHLGNLGNYAEAAVVLAEALDLARFQGDLYQEAMVLALLANMQYEYGEYEHAREKYLRVLDVLAGLDDKTAYVLNRMHLLVIHLELSEFAEAERIVREAQEYAEKYGSSADRIMVYQGRSKLQLKQGHLLPARITLETAIHLAQATGTTFGLTGLLITLGEVYSSQQDYQRALTVLEQARTRAVETGDSPGLTRALRVLAETHARRGNFEEAYILMREFHEQSLLLQRHEAHMLFLSTTARLEAERWRYETVRPRAMLVRSAVDSSEPTFTGTKGI